jgi:hypothetical protein
MRTAGAELNNSGFDADWVRVMSCPAASSVRTWSGGTVFSIHVLLLGLAPKTILQGFELSSPAWEFAAYVLDDPSAESLAPRPYRTLDGSLFDQTEALNHRVGPRGVLRHGDVMEGLLLAECLSPIPTREKPWARMPLCLSVVNQFDDVQTLQFELPVEHVVEQVRRWPPRSRSVFGEERAPNKSAVPAPDDLPDQQSARSKEDGRGRGPDQLECSE